MFDDVSSSEFPLAFLPEIDVSGDDVSFNEPFIDPYDNGDYQEVIDYTPYFNLLETQLISINKDLTVLLYVVLFVVCVRFARRIVNKFNTHGKGVNDD